MIALCAFVWFFSGVNAEVSFQSFCLSELTPTLFTVVWPLSSVGEQMLGEL